MGICNKIAGALTPIILGAIALKDTDALVGRLDGMTAIQKSLELDDLAERVITPYLIMAAILIFLGVLIYLSSLPEIDTDQYDNRKILPLSIKGVSYSSPFPYSKLYHVFVCRG